MKTVERIDITIPIDVHRKLKKIKKEQRVNVSAIALEAFIAFINGESLVVENMRLREENHRLGEMIKNAQLALTSSSG